MVTVPAGQTAIGCDPVAHADWCEDPQIDCCGATEQPATVVPVAAFDIDQTEVTVAAYQACVDASRCIHRVGPRAECNRYHPDRAHYPVNCITHAEARAFCDWSGKRLCSEAEWEKAARGGCEFWPGDCAVSTPPSWFGWRYPTCDDAVVSPVTGGPPCGYEDGSGPVGSRELGASLYGAHDLLGNVYEFVEDCFHFDHVGRPLDGSAWTSSCAQAGAPGTNKGGSGVNPRGRYASGFRRAPGWAGHESCCGFRCCKNAE